ncbi:gliding motility-associated protein GldE [Parafilimonas sp.]|uniref:gliding motility-associated protein GldE n=1 Tax=Parafilimonas sp. TaxID=1969739 RepID=UPI0039E38F89
MEIPSLLFSFLQIHTIDSQATTVLVFLLIACMLLSFVVSGAEVAFFSLNFKEINLLKTKEQSYYKRVIDLLEDPKGLQASLLIANIFSNIAIIIISNQLLDTAFLLNNPPAFIVQFLTKLVIVAVIIVLFCEVMPKIYAGQNNIRFLKNFGLLTEGIYYIFHSMGGWLVKYFDVMEKRLSDKNKSSYSMQELDHAIDITTNNAASEKEKNILKGIVKFGNITVKQIMRTRLHVSGIEYNTSFFNLLQQVEELHYSRLPVYKHNLDEIVGLINTKDLLQHLNSTEDFDWHSLLRPITFVHSHKLIDDLLHEFQQKRIHFAVVVDEFGGTSGIVTLEDILEEVIGDIHDEFDEEDIEYTKVDDNTYIFEGSIMIYDACRIMQLPPNTFDPVRGESDSLAGLVLEIAGEIPQQNQVITSGDFEFIVLEINKNRLQKIKITIKPQHD